MPYFTVKNSGCHLVSCTIDPRFHINEQIEFRRLIVVIIVSIFAPDF